jgi:release factor glutamine methyltransferase
MFHYAAKVAFMLLCCMKTVKDVFADFKEGLETLYDVNEISSLSLLVISEICDLPRAKVKAFPEMNLSEHQTKILDDVLVQLKTGKPVQYVLGKTEFYGLTFTVNPSVLIPRPETEELVEWVLASISNFKLPIGSNRLVAANILDIGTGSGCIAISLKKNLPDFDISAVDISNEALDTAKTNAELNEVTIQFIEADILQEHQSIINSYSIIISNPPYVTPADKTQMHTNVTDFEPHTALFVPENDPLIFYRAIADFAIGHLKANGLLFFEINENYGKETVELLADKGFKNIELRKDMSGRDRMIKASA